MYAVLSNILILSLKEIKSLLSDVILVALMVYFFTAAVVVAAKGASQEVRNAPVAVVDHDRSALSRRLMDAVLPPHFKRPVAVESGEVQRHMDLGDFYFVLDIPPGYEEKILKGERPRIQLLVDATAMTLAGTGTGYLTSVLGQELSSFTSEAAGGIPRELARAPRAVQAVNVLFNPNASAVWHMGVVQIVGNLTLLTLMLSGAAIIREKERGTIEHLLVMPVSAGEIAAAKIAANGTVIVALALCSLYVIVHTALGVPVEGSFGLLTLGMFVYVLSFASLGILLAVMAPSMPQFGLLCIPVYMLVYLLSGGTSPAESMPEQMQQMIQVSPTTQFVAFIQDVVHRGADVDNVGGRLLVMLLQGLLFLAVALLRFKSMLLRQG